MVSNEGRDILRKLYQLSFPDPSEFIDYPFKFSNNWQKGFLKRHNFSLRIISKSNNFTTDKKEWTYKP